VGDTVKQLRCSARTFMVLSSSKRYLYTKCRDSHCVDAAYAKDTGKIAVHRFDLRSNDVYMASLFFDDEAAYRQCVAST
jgi:hypothetical protein